MAEDTITPWKSHWVALRHPRNVSQYGATIRTVSHICGIVVVDSGSDKGWAIWVDCTDDICEGHSRYIPGPSYVNWTTSDQTCYGFVGSNDCVEGWTGNDTVSWGALQSPLTIDAVYTSRVSQSTDGILGVSKSYWYGAAGRCTGFVSFVEQAFAAGKIANPVLSFYLVRKH